MLPSERVTQEDRNQAYLDRIAQYKDTPYYKDLLANPYAPQNRAAYTPSWWEENISQNIFQDFSKENAWVAQQNQSEAEYIAQVVGKNTERKLNSESAKVAQMIAAGENPDLLGTQGVSDAPSGTMPDDTPPGAPQPEAVGEGPMGQIMNLFQSALQEGFGIANFFMDAHGKLITQGAAELQFNDDAYNHLLDYIAGQVHFDPDNEDGEDKLAKDLGIVVDNLLDPAKKMAPALAGNKYLRRAITNLRGTITVDPKTNKPSAAYQRARSKIISDIVNNTTSAANGMSREGFNLNLKKYSTTLYETFTKIETALTKLENQARQKKAKYESDYYGATAKDESGRTISLGAAEGQAGIKEAEAKGSAAVSQKALEDAINDVNAEFDTLKTFLQSKDDVFSNGLLLMLPFLRHRTIAVIRDGFSGSILNSLIK